ncbi:MULTISPECIES: hypothetical protein [unclassified Microcoleus]|uniref:hypothetical protein n=1 Tax=unclassified Microcoleus TaxID=2642155 RepID=UPI002FD2D31D
MPLGESAQKTKARANFTPAMGVELLSFHQQPGSQTQPEAIDYTALSLPPVSSYRFRARKTLKWGLLAQKKKDNYREKLTL